MAALFGDPICVKPNTISSVGIFFQGRKMGSFPVLAVQLVLLSTVPRFIHHLLLKRYGQPLFVSQLIGGILCGQLTLLKKGRYRHLFFPGQYRETLETLAQFSSLFYLFKVGVKTDPTIISRAGRRPFVIGSFCFLTSFASGFFTLRFISNWVTWDYPNHQTTRIILVSSMTSFPVISIYLSDLNILNSDIGHLASASSMVSDICQVMGYAFFVLAKQILHRTEDANAILIPILPFLIFIGFVVRPLAVWVVKRTPEGEEVREIYLLGMFIIVLLSGFTFQMMGLPCLLGAFVLGLAIPEGPPLGSIIVDKLEYLVTLLFMPLLIGITCMKSGGIDLTQQEGLCLVITEVALVLACCVGKIVGAVFPCMYYGVPVRDSWLLGLVMNMRGIVEISVVNAWMDSSSLDASVNTVYLLTILMIVSITTPVARHLYDPSTRYLAYKRKSFSYSQRELQDFRVLACIRNEDDVPPVIRLLEATTPTKIHPLTLTVLHLVELVGRASPILVAHPSHPKRSSNPNKSERITNAFRIFEQQNHGVVSFKTYSTICPYVTMHEDICSVSLERKVSLIIFPFPKQRGSDDPSRKASNRSMKSLLQNLLDTAPCSLGILVDSAQVCLTTSITTYTIYRVGVLFLGGPDDREALAYAMSMIRHPSIYGTVTRFVASSNSADGIDNANVQREKLLDDELLNYYRDKAMDMERLDYQEVEVKDGVETVRVIRSISGDYDLMMVGRRQCTDSNVMAGLSDEWSEYVELGIIGDLLASSDLGEKGSVLVLQGLSDQ